MTFERQDVELYIPTTRGEAYIEKDRQAEQANYRLMAANGRIKWLERRLERAENTAGWPSEKTFQEGFRRGLTAEQIIAANPVQARKGNPSPKAREYWYRTPTEAYKVAEALRKQGLDAVVVNGSQKAHKAGYKAMVRIQPKASTGRLSIRTVGLEPSVGGAE